MGHLPIVEYWQFHMVQTNIALFFPSLNFPSPPPKTITTTTKILGQVRVTSPWIMVFLTSHLYVSLNENLDYHTPDISAFEFVHISQLTMHPSIYQGSGMSMKFCSLIPQIFSECLHCCRHYSKHLENQWTKQRSLFC